MIVRTATVADAAAIVAIYNHYVTDTIVTFEETPLDAAEMSSRIAAVQLAGLPWLVAEIDGLIAGYAYATGWRARIGYRFSVEVTVYLEHRRVGRGIGSTLYAELFRLLEECGVHVVIGGIALPNDASVALHENFGMEKVAHFSEVGTKFGKWIDVGFWQRTYSSRDD